MAPAAQNQVVFSLYKAFLRQTRKLPNLYLRQFWRIKGFDDVRAILQTDNGIRDQKIKRMAKDLRKLEAANKRSIQAFNHILDVAYGRKGKLKRELMEPILTDPTASLPSRIIPAVESSRPPVYSKELRVLLTTPASRIGKALTPKALDSPPTLPPRADPDSNEARLLGPFSKRRETNTRWRFFAEASQKVLPPLQVVVENDTGDTPTRGVSRDDLLRAGVRGLPLQGLHVFEDVEILAAQRPRYSPKSNHVLESHSPRWLRRRYRSLLNRLPILTYTTTENKPPRYSVSLSNELEGETIVDADDSNLEWIEENTPPKSDPEFNEADMWDFESVEPSLDAELSDLEWLEEDTPPAVEPTPKTGSVE
ncbi:hypothetical protein DFH06DRAFT_487414 [Mycena polygramma]|nr:hypothetical protein DFH06DRAFT_487414 [Mycena polygramma]